MTHLINTNSQICFTKKDLRLSFPMTTGASVPANTLDSLIKRALKQEKLLQLKKGLYMTSTCYIHEPDKAKLSEYLASQIYQPSYISLEYVLEKYHLLSRTTSSPSECPDASFAIITPITSITLKPTHTFKNFSGTYRYTNIKSALYIGNNQTHDENNLRISHDDEMKTENNTYLGYKEHTFHGHTYHIATKAKALFDYLYMKSDLKRRNTTHLRRQLFKEPNLQPNSESNFRSNLKSNLHWANFSEEDFKEFEHHVWQSKSKKMMRVLDVIAKYFANKKFDAWKKELLS
ncbi:MAG: hypothetical protein Q8P62_01825 [Candidatus Peregrinibacteria bacterium]|nr:hypothetical protein [Candidatus Peregrinibacteria bacterium]